VTGPTVVGSEACRDFARSSKLEWLETNGTGAFAMGTAAGVNTRRYHALLVASLQPSLARRVLLSRVEEEAVVDGRDFPLGACQYPGVVAPRGFELLQEFRPEPCATWIYEAGGARIEKQVYLAEGRPAVVVRYRADRTVTLRVRPFLANRDYHSLQHAGERFETPLHIHCDAKFVEDAHWYYNVEYLEELDRGLDFREDLYTPGVYVFDLKPGEWASLCASADGAEGAELLTSQPASKRNPFLVQRANGSPTIIAGYPWFTDWGRDSMISLPGLLIAQGQLEPAREIIEACLKTRKQGLIPNRFPDAGTEPEYNSVDATLWMFQAMRAWLEAGGDGAFLRDVFYPAAREIIDWHMRGTLNGIGVDPRDHLLRAGGPDTQLTWMDAKVGDRVITPRHGKPVEINALWHSALCLMAEWGDDDCWVESFRVQQSFRELFWNDQRECLYDVLTDDGPDAKLRPNQIIAVSLGEHLLGRVQQQAVVRIVERALLTPVGLRTLERGDPEYRPRYEGGPAERDGAYHQGTVWPWLLGPFVDAYLAAFGRSVETMDYCKGLVRQLEEEAARGPCLGSIPEIYDGDEPRLPRGCPAQAWSVAEVARLKARLGRML
jgi:glycogen debranching enzyme